MSVDTYMSREHTARGKQEILEVDHHMRTVCMKNEKYETTRLPSNRFWHLTMNSPQMVSKYQLRDIRQQLIVDGYVEVK